MARLILRVTVVLIFCPLVLITACRDAAGFPDENMNVHWFGNYLLMNIDSLSFPPGDVGSIAEYHRNSLLRAMSSWIKDNVTGTNLTIEYISTPAPPGNNNDGLNTIGYSTPPWGVDALTSGRWDDELNTWLEVDTEVVPQFWDSPYDPPTATPPYERISLEGFFRHEMGHAVGLYEEENRRPRVATMNGDYSFGSTGPFRMHGAFARGVSGRCQDDGRKHGMDEGGRHGVGPSLERWRVS